MPFCSEFDNISQTRHESGRGDFSILKPPSGLESDTFLSISYHKNVRISHNVLSLFLLLESRSENQYFMWCANSILGPDTVCTSQRSVKRQESYSIDSCFLIYLEDVNTTLRNVTTSILHVVYWWKASRNPHVHISESGRKHVHFVGLFVGGKLHPFPVRRV